MKYVGLHGKKMSLIIFKAIKHGACLEGARKMCPGTNTFRIKLLSGPADFAANSQYLLAKTLPGETGKNSR
jgi:hypothetical protein